MTATGIHAHELWPFTGISLATFCVLLWDENIVKQCDPEKATTVA